MKKGANNTYWGNIQAAIGSLAHGLKLTLRHIWQARESRKPIGIADERYFDQKEGIVTLQYPRVSFPVPDNSRYRLHNEIEDCIVCDKCAKICPVNCIEIEPVRAVDEDLGKTSDGTPKRIHAAKFDIDMGKCCFCGLCTTVCPTECLTMTKAYDFSEFDVADHVYAFAEMTPLEILEKKQKLEAYNEAKAKSAANQTQSYSGVARGAKPALKPKPQTSRKPTEPIEERESEGNRVKDLGDKNPGQAKPVFKPKMKPVAKKEEVPNKEPSTSSEPTAKPKFRPKIKPVTKKQEEGGEEKEKKSSDAGRAKPKPVFKPKIKSKTNEGEESKKVDSQPGASKSKPIIKPKINPVEKKSKDESGEDTKPSAEKRPKPIFRPKIKPKKGDD